MRLNSSTSKLNSNKRAAPTISIGPKRGSQPPGSVRFLEVNASLDPREFTIKNAVERMEQLGTDPVRPVLEDTLDLAGVLGRLAAREGAGG